VNPEKAGLSRAIRNHRTLSVFLVVVGSLPEWWLSAPLRGELVACFDISRGHYEVLGYGLVSPTRYEYTRLLRERYGVEYRAVADCIVSLTLVSYAGGYNTVSMFAARRKFGHDVFQECEEDAIKNVTRRSAANASRE
jgi:hypothetical protein